jgi:hypothetical protein
LPGTQQAAGHGQTHHPEADEADRRSSGHGVPSFRSGAMFRRSRRRWQAGAAVLPPVQAVASHFGFCILLGGTGAWRATLPPVAA